MAALWAERGPRGSAGLERRLPVKVVACCMAMAGFAVATVSGLHADRSADQILLQALLSLAACYAVGFAIGLAAETAVRESLGDHERLNPMPGAERAGAAPHPVTPSTEHAP